MFDTFKAWLFSALTWVAVRLSPQGAKDYAQLRKLVARYSIASDEGQRKQVERGLDKLLETYAPGLPPLDDATPAFTYAQAEEAFRPEFFSGLAEGEDIREALICMAEEGFVGTPIIRGEISIEENSDYAPVMLRGVNGSHAFCQEAYKTDTIVFDSVNSISEAIISGVIELQLPRVLPEDDAQQELMRRWVRFHNAKLKQVKCGRGGWATALENIMSFAYVGWSIVEPVWETDLETGWSYPWKLSFREQATLYRWVVGGRGDDLMSAMFKLNTSDEAAPEPEFMLHFVGDQIEDISAILFNIFARGNNFEGNSPPRSCAFWIKSKRMVAPMILAGAEKYLVPITYIRSVLEKVNKWRPKKSDVRERDDLQDIIEALQAMEVPVVGLPDGLEVNTVAVDGLFPEAVLKFVEYCDRQILQVFSNEGSALGLHSSASAARALGEVKERDWLRSVPVYARRVTEPLDQIYQQAFVQQLGFTPPEFPKWVYRVEVEDMLEKLENVRELMGNTPIETWPPKLQAWALEVMKLDPQILDREDEDVAEELPSSEEEE